MVQKWTSTPRASFVSHNLTTSDIKFTGEDTAVAFTYFTTLRNIGPDHAGTYEDRFVKKGNKWLLAERQVRADWLSRAALCFTLA